MTERVILNILLYKEGDQLSLILHGFMKGHSTNGYLHQCFSTPGITCRVFVDYKGAFDRANKDVIMEELLQECSGQTLKLDQGLLVWSDGTGSVPRCRLLRGRV